MMDFTICVHICGQGGERAKEGEKPLGPCPTHSSLGTPDAPLTTRRPQWPAHLASVYECSRLELRPCCLLYLVRTCEGKGVCHIKCPAIPEDGCAREGKEETARVPSGRVLAQSMERAGGSPGSPSSAGEGATGWWYRPTGGRGSNNLKKLWRDCELWA